MITTLSDYLAQNGDREIDAAKLDEVLQIKRSKVWKPEDGEPLWSIDSDGAIYPDVFNEEDVAFARMLETGIAFKTEEDAKACVEYLKTHTALKRYAAEHNEGAIDWNDCKAGKYIIELGIDSIGTKYIFVDSWFTIRMARQVYFTSREIAEAAVREIGEERIKQYLLYEG